MKFTGILDLFLTVGVYVAAVPLPGTQASRIPPSVASIRRKSTSGTEPPSLRETRQALMAYPAPPRR
ncbi:hypothetical protein AYL99_12011 [Fonsecaea erecta]|uniref:Uncharacterized protein n=1 Tax=Fonsecaea erecta TaxID=1367422 RepID=A0A178Z1W5_9EURO|nr:hypothetical protein AYL99_12011 [Fonsecaea erecta]OAP53792.1 hypothetical protein AYL99_12011 [Fonsecaea erecta]